MLAFIIWLAVGLSMVALGIYAILAKKEVAFGF